MSDEENIFEDPHFMKRILLKMDYDDFSRMHETCRSIKEICDNEKLKISVDFAQIFVNGRGIWLDKHDYEIGREKRIPFKSLSQNVRVLARSIVIQRPLHPALVKNLLKSFALKEVRCEKFRCEQNVICQPHELDALLKLVGVKFFDIQVFLQKPFFNMETIQKVDLNAPGCDIDDDQLIRLKGENLFLRSDSITAQGINRFIKQWRNGQREISVFDLEFDNSIGTRSFAAVLEDLHANPIWTPALHIDSLIHDIPLNRFPEMMTGDPEHLFSLWKPESCQEILIIRLNNHRVEVFQAESEALFLGGYVAEYNMLEAKRNELRTRGERTQQRWKPRSILRFLLIGFTLGRELSIFGKIKISKNEFIFIEPQPSTSVAMENGEKKENQVWLQQADENPLTDEVVRALEAAETQQNDRLDRDAQLIGVGSTFTPSGGMITSPCSYSPEEELWKVEEKPSIDQTPRSHSYSPSPRRRKEAEDSVGSPRTSPVIIRTPPYIDVIDANAALRDQHLSDNLRASLLMSAKPNETNSLAQNASSSNYSDPQDQPLDMVHENISSPKKHAPPPINLFGNNPSSFIFKDGGQTIYQRIVIDGEELSEVPHDDLRRASQQLIEALKIREEYIERLGTPGNLPLTTKYFLSGKYPSNLPDKFIKTEERMNSQLDYHPPPPIEDHWGKKQALPAFQKIYRLVRRNGVIEVVDPHTREVPEELKKSLVNKDKFLSDQERLGQMVVDGPLKSFCYRRLSLLQHKFSLHVLMNELRELHEQKMTSHKDFYNVRKVDTHIHAASSMNQKHLVRFIKKKLKKEGEAIVMEKDGVKMTLKDIFRQLGITAEDLSVDMLDVHADRYNPIGDSSLRETFLKTDNYVKGRYFAELLKEVFTDLEDSKYQHTEMRLSIYGRTRDEWDKLAKWAIDHDVWSRNVRWMVQFPRLYDIYRVKNMVKNFDEILENLFTPLFEATNDPKSHPELCRFLAHVSGFDSVDDESKHEFVQFDRSTPLPQDYKDQENPPYNYYLFYLYSNICSLNGFRQMRGFNTFALRPHCGEAGHVNHLLAAYMTSESISHGILLRKVPVLQYLFYLSQMGIAMSPLSNNSLFISYQRNPLPEYLQKGLNVSLSTDDPLQFHYTREALMEEYSIAAQVWKLSSCDMCELARNSVLQSGFEEKLKCYWLGGYYKEEGVLGNDIRCTNVPDIRVSFRHDCLTHELKNLFRGRLI